MLRFLLSAAVAATALATPAFAQEAKGDFTGLRLEGLVGYDESLTYGGAAGFDFQSGGAVLGLEGEYLESSDKECEATVAPVGGRLCDFVGRDIYVGGRVGAAVAPGTLIYAKAGYTNVRLGATLDNGAGSTSLIFSQKLDGIRVGAGVEQKLGGKFYVKGEYRYSDYEAGTRKHDAVVGLGIRF